MSRVVSTEKRALFAYFLAIIAMGTALLALPGAWNGGSRLKAVDALFTAVSAVCVTGLISVDTACFSRFGQLVLLLLIQAGGLGIITFSTIYLARPRGKLSLVTHRFVRAYYLDSVELQPLAIIRNIVAVTLAFELLGALVLYQAFARSVGRGALFAAVFHSVSAFCNAGFSVFSTSLEAYTTDVLVNVTIICLIVLGGIGFVVLQDLAATVIIRRKRLTLHSRIVLLMTLTLVLGAAALFLLFEARRAYAPLDPSHKVLAAVFQAVTPRTAGFDTVPQPSLSGPSKMLTLLLMFVGGASGSIAGGIKVNTLFILLLMALQGPDSRGELTLFKRKIGAPRVSYATMHAVKALMLLFAGILLLSISEMWFSRHQVDLFALVFEAFSAFGTVGLSLGATPGLTAVGKLVIMVIMFMGRIGLLALAIPRSRPYPAHVLDYPEGEVMIG